MGLLLRVCGVATVVDLLLMLQLRLFVSRHCNNVCSSLVVATGGVILVLLQMVVSFCCCCNWVCGCDGYNIGCVFLCWC